MSRSETKKRTGQLNRKKAIAILLFNFLSEKESKSSIHYMKILLVNEEQIYSAIRILKELGLAKTFNGNVGGGIKKTRDIPLSLLCNLLGVGFANEQQLIDSCDEVIDATQKYSICDICNESVPCVDKHGMCIDCIELKQPEQELKLARCGHLSKIRYFNCEECQPELESEEIGDYRTSLNPKRGAM